jgi:hypothetical protein
MSESLHTTTLIARRHTLGQRHVGTFIYGKLRRIFSSIGWLVAAILLVLLSQPDPVLAQQARVPLAAGHDALSIVVAGGLMSCAQVKPFFQSTMPDR